jgi:predicted AlkP superfamily phosphohydrolase/phosphomutase
MRFLRVLTNCLMAGALGAAYLTILILQLNPEVPLASPTVWRWYATLAASYGVHISLTFYVVMLLRDFASVELFSPGWISVRLLAWLSAVSAGVASALMWLNLTGLTGAFLDPDARRFATGAAATSASALVLFGIAVAHYSFGRRGSRVGAALLVIAITGSLALPIAARGPGGEPPLGARRVSLETISSSTTAPRVIMVLLEGASLEYIWPRVAEGRLPNLGRVLDSGASLDLATIRPTQPDPVWAAVATGMYPAKNGVRSAAAYFAAGDTRSVDLLPENCLSHTLIRLGIVRDQPNSSSALRARPIWSILNDYGVATGVVRWPLTYPAQSVRGFLVTDRFHQVIGSLFEFDGRAVYPPDLEPVARNAFVQADASRGVVEVPLRAAAGSDTAAAGWDRSYGRAMRALQAVEPVQFAAIRYQGLDTLGHYYLRYAQPQAFNGVTEEDRQRFGAVLDRYYTYIDGEVGAAMDRLQPRDLLLIVSAFGMQPVDPLKRLVARLLRDPDVSGTHERAPDGFLLAYGGAVDPGRKQRGSIVDVTPTILYFLGVPIGRDMDGFARADLFSGAFKSDRPITFIPSHGR